LEAVGHFGFISVGEYETRQRAFHAALTGAPPPGFDGSFSVGLTHLPWEAGGGDAYEDWYLVKDFSALGLLNEAAVSNRRAVAHDAAATVAAGGSGGLYGLRQGAVLRYPLYAHWFSKPKGMQTAELFEQLSPIVEQAQGALWMRQLALGSAQQFCIHSTKPAFVPAELSPFSILLRQIWPE
jgi:hypothetical protein